MPEQSYVQSIYRPVRRLQLTNVILALIQLKTVSQTETSTRGTNSIAAKHEKRFASSKQLTFRSLSSKFAMSGCPYLIAVMSARIPRFVLSTSQPARHKSLTRLICPCRAATCSAVRPRLFGVSRSIPLSIRRVVIPSSPVSQAMCKRVSSFCTVMRHLFYSPRFLLITCDIGKVKEL